MKQNGKIISLCKDNLFEYINNGNVSNIHLFDNALHLLESDVCILANNFVCKLDTFTDTFTPYKRTFLTNGILVTHENSGSDQSLDMQILSKNRLKYPTNLLIGYLNISSLRNKIINVRDVIGKLSLDYFVNSETKLNESFPSAQFNITTMQLEIEVIWTKMVVG